MNDDRDSRILIVDDDEKTLNMLAEMLSEEDYKLSYAVNGEDALKNIENSDIDLVLLDIELPDINGIEIARRVHEDKERPELPLIFITGHSEDFGIEEAFDNEGFDYITKPVSQQQLLARVEHALEVYSYRTELENKVRQRTEELEEKNEALKRANQALEELLDRFEERKEQTWKKIRKQIRNRIEPQIEKLENRVRDRNKEHVELIKEQITEIFENKQTDFSGLRSKLSQREFEICMFIRKGLTSKEIASTLGRALSTVKTHRRNIREKLEITNEDINLKEYINQF